MDNMIIAKRIQHYRHLAKLSQEQLADLVDASDTYIRKLEAGVRILCSVNLYHCRWKKEATLDFNRSA